MFLKPKNFTDRITAWLATGVHDYSGAGVGTKKLVRGLERGLVRRG